MVATAESSFVENGEYTQAHSRAFFWTMVALAVLDVILLFWILNPVSKPVTETRPVQTTLGDSAAKRSPLGAVASRVPKVTRTRTGFTTVAYNGR